MESDKAIAVVSAKGAARWASGHPWIYKSDLLASPRRGPGILRVHARRGAPLAQALFPPRREIRLGLLTRSEEPIDAAWWRFRIAASAARREGIAATAYRVVHA